MLLVMDFLCISAVSRCQLSLVASCLSYASLILVDNVPGTKWQSDRRFQLGKEADLAFFPNAGGLHSTL